MIAVMTSNTIYHLIWSTKWLGCNRCTLLMSSYFVSRVVVKGINQIFLLHRAKVVQGMAPVLSKKWFEKILPAIIGVIVVVFTFGSIIGAMDTHWICHRSDDDWSSIETCTRLQDTDPPRMTAALWLGLDLVTTIFLTVLFVVPLQRAAITPIEVMDANQRERRRKLKHLLLWSVVLTLLNQITSSLSMLMVAFPSKFTIGLYMVGLFDPAINVWTAWLMVSRNRQYLQRVCCCCRMDARRRPSVALTDIPSKLKAEHPSKSDIPSRFQSLGRMSRLLTITPTPTICDRLEMVQSVQNRGHRRDLLSISSNPESGTPT